MLEYFNKNGKLPSPKVACSKCNEGVTMFGTNLENRIKKFGGLSNLLETFVCRNCKGASKPAKKASTPRIKKEKEEVIYEIPKMKMSIPRDVYLKDAPDIIQSITAFSCAAPSLYLDNGRNCYGCSFFSNCLCHLKKEVA